MKLTFLTIQNLKHLNLLDRQQALDVPVLGGQLLLHGERDQGGAIPRVVLRHVRAVGVPGGDVGVLPVNLDKSDCQQIVAKI